MSLHSLNLTLRSFGTRVPSRKMFASVIEFSLFGGIVTAMAIGVLRLH